MKIIPTIGLIGTMALLGGCSMLPISNTLSALVSDKGSIRIAIPGASLKTQAQMTDIDHVLFSVESKDRSTNAISPITLATQSISYSNGTPSVGYSRFDGLWPGEATVSATIYGSNPIRTQALHTQSLLEVLGTTTATVSVVSGHLTDVPLSIKMVNTQTQAGNLFIQLGIQEGDEELLPLQMHD